jgi:hypothetical protein
MSLGALRQPTALVLVLQAAAAITAAAPVFLLNWWSLLQITTQCPRKPQRRLDTVLRQKLMERFGDRMTIEQAELEREMVPIVDRCFRGCGTRAVWSDGFSNFCAKCALAILTAQALRPPVRAN